MEDIIQVQDQFYILATASKARERTAVLKHDDTFAVFDMSGDIGAFGAGEQGLYHEDTRYLSRFRLRLNGRRPLLLSARVKDDNELFGADLTNPDIPLPDGGLCSPRDLVHLFRARFLWNGTWHERLRLWNYSHRTRPSLADVRHRRRLRRHVRGARHPPPTARIRLEPVVAGTELRLGYRGLDDEERWTVVEWSDSPAAAAAGAVRFEYDLAPRSQAVLSCAIRCERQHRPVPATAFELAESAALAAVERARGEYAIVESSSERFNQW